MNWRLAFSQDKPDSVRVIYVAGPMAGIAEHNFPAFRAMAERLERQGYEVLCPAAEVDDHDLEAAVAAGTQFRNTAKYREYLLRDIQWVFESDAVQLLPGWEKSLGARAEVAVAKAIGLEIWEPL